MIVYLSLGGNPTIDVITTIAPPEKINVLTSFQYKNNLKGYKPRQFKNFMADSGAFTAMNAGKKIDDNYIDQYIKWINENDIQNFVEMDLDEIIGYEDVLKLRKKIEIQTGKKPIPVWHNVRGEDGWRQMCYEYPYVAISLSLMTNTSKWLKQYDYEPLDWFMTEARKAGAKVHALGCNNLQLMEKYRFYSADSSTHTSGRRFGSIIGIKNGKVGNIRPKNGLKLDFEKAEIFNTKQMLEIMKYAEQKL